MTDSSKNLQNLGICLLVLLALTLLAYFAAPIIKPVEESGLDTSPSAMGLRFLFMALGALAVLGVCFATRENPAWEVNAQKIVYMVIGSVIYGVFAWMFNGSTFNIPALSQVSLRPAVVLPVFFGFMFGPSVGFMVGAGGNLVGDLFIGTVSPHWTMANGLIGLFAGMPALFDDQRQSIDVGTVIAAIGAVVAGGFFLANPGTTFQPTPTSAPTTLSLFMGLSVVVGCGLAIAVRFAFPNRPQWAEAVVWGAAGNVVALFLASIADIWVNQYTLIDTAVGQFIPTSGPNIIAVAILVPLLLAAYAASQQPENA
jgi:energy-coupling factor transport system substrate-specific component